MLKVTADCLRAAVLVSGLVFALLPACGDDRDGNPDSAVARDAARVDAASVDAASVDGGSVDVGPGGSVTEAQAPEALVRAWCENQNRCGCGREGEGVEDCVTRLLPIKQTEYEGYQDMGLTYDAACVEVVLTSIAELGCGGPPATLYFRPYCGLCPIYYGGLPLGDGTCGELRSQSGSLCSKGEACLSTGGSESACQVNCDGASRAVARTGQPCDVATGDQCDLNGASCTRGVCQAHPSAGERCLGAVCGYGLSCNEGTSLCQESLPLGGACTDSRACATRSCEEGSCVAVCFAPFF